MAKRRKKRKIKRAVNTPSRLFRRRKRLPILPEAIRPWVFGIILLLIAVFTLLSFFKSAGVAGQVFLKFINLLVGQAAFLLPLIFVLGGLSCFGSKEKSRWSILLAVVFLVLGAAGILGVQDLSRAPEFGFQFFYSGNGGWLGNLFAWPMLRIFGFWLSQIIFSVLIIISGLIFWFFLYLPWRKKELLRQREVEEGEEVEEELEKPLIRRVFAPKFQVTKIEAQKEEKAEEKVAEPEIVPEFAPKIKPLEGKELETTGWNLPSLELLAEDKGTPQAGDVKTNAEIIEKTLEHFGISVKMSEINVGPTVTQYTLKPAEGVKLSKITALSNNLALALAAHPLRIEAPIPGKSLVGVEVPNKTRTLVRLRNLFSTPEFQNAASDLTFSIGRDVVGKPFYADLSRMPHLLVAGSTGSGKTICLSGIISSLLYRNSPEQLRFLLIDPKRVEFTNYNGLPHLLGPVIFDVQKTLSVLKWLIEEMEKRFEVLSATGARNIYELNQKVNSKNNKQEIMPYIILIIDELADLMAAKGREIETGIVKLAQKARAVGIHLILATQRPSVEVITGLIKANITSRIAFQVASQVDSRTILDTAGADKLLGQGDLLFISAEFSRPKRIQGNYVSSKEVEKVVDFIKKQNHKEGKEDALTESISAELERIERFGAAISGADIELDPVYQEAKRLVLETRKASASFLQRKLRIGYARAARLLDMLEERGVVGPADGAKPREVYITAPNVTRPGRVAGGEEEALLGEQEEEEVDENEEKL